MKDHTIPKDLKQKYDHLQEILSQMRSVLVAFSGGVDSTLLLTIAIHVLEERAVAATALSESLSRSQHDRVNEFIQTRKIPHMELPSPEMEDPHFLKNDKDRCYYCKKIKFGLMRDLAKSHLLEVVIDGSNPDDLTDYRPGHRAIRELGVRSPFIEAGIGKEDIRNLARHKGLSMWDLPSDSCLVTRIPYHHPITREKLVTIEKGEAFLKQMGLSSSLRARHHEGTVRLEIAPGEIFRFSDDDFRETVTRFFKHLGFHHVTLDLEGYRTGSMNRSLHTE